MQSFPSSETVLLGSNSAPAGGDDMDINFGDVFGGPPNRRSKVNEVSRHSFNETALRRRDVIVDVDGALIPRDAFWDGRDEKPVFGEDTSIRRRFTADDFFDDIFRVNETSSSPRLKKEQELFGSSPRVLGSLARLTNPNLPGGLRFLRNSVFPAKATEIPTFGSATRSLSKNKETASTSSLSRTSSKADMVSTAKSDSDGCDDAPQVVVTGKGRQFLFSIYKCPNKGVPVIIWGSSRLSSMAKAEETTPSDPRSTSVEKAGKDEEGEGESRLSGLKEEKKTSQKHPGVHTEDVKTEMELMSEEAFSGVSKEREANVKPLHSIFHENDERQGEDIVSEREVRKGKSKAKNTRSSTEESRTKKKLQGTKSSLDSSSSPPEVGKDGVKGKVMDFVKIFSQGASVGAGGESLGQSSRWRAKETPRTDINHDGANAKETVNIPDQQKKSTPDIPGLGSDTFTGNSEKGFKPGEREQ